MTNNVIFKYGTQEKYDALTVKNQNTLYYIYDTQRMYRGDTLYGTGAEATQMAAGLMSAADKAKLDSLINTQISQEPGNRLEMKPDGLYVADVADIPTYTVEKLSGQNTYRLKETIDGASQYIGDPITIPEDLVVQEGSLEIVVTQDVPYSGAQVGDPYIDLVLNDPNADHIYIPVKELIDVYTAGQGIAIHNNEISILLSPTVAHGLTLAADGLALDLATNASDGAMSATDKEYIDSLPDELNKKTNILAEDATGKSYVFNEPSGGGAMYVHSDDTWSFIGTTNNGNGGINGQLYAIDGNTKVGTRIMMTTDGFFYTKGASSPSIDALDELVTKRDIKDIEAGTIYWDEMN